MSCYGAMGIKIDNQFRVDRFDTMPLDFTMLLGTSPPSINYVSFEAMPSPFDDLAGLVVDTEAPYQCRRASTFPMVTRHITKSTNSNCRSVSESVNLHKLETLNLVNNADAGPSVPIRARKNSDDETREKTTTAKSRKKVAFADDRGFQLVKIRLMTEPSDMPPKISPAVIRALLGDKWKENDSIPAATWMINFKQPASDYIAFRQKLDALFVSTENVMMKNDQCRLVGTVKVKNVSFEKQVFIRITYDEWSSFTDQPCTYAAHRRNDAHDTFQFDFEIPRDDPHTQQHQIEFCVCFKANSNMEYWDNNGGRNYEIISEHLRKQRVQTPVSMAGGQKREDGKRNGYYTKPVMDAVTLNCSNWTNFASWCDLSTEGPYW